MKIKQWINFGKWLTVVGLLVATSLLSFDKHAQAQTLPPAPTPNCPEGAFRWVNNIDTINLDDRGVIQHYDIRLRADGITGANPIQSTQYTIPGPYPALLGENRVVKVQLLDVIAYDAYLTRASVGDQPQERFKVVFLKNGRVIWESQYTNELDTGEQVAEWRGNLGEAILPNGADEIQFVHWGDGQPGDNPNSLYPAGLCVRVSELTPPPTLHCPTGRFSWVNDIDVVNLDARGVIQNYTVRLGTSNDPTHFTIPGPYPTSFSSRIHLEVNVLTYDAYLNRTSADNQPHEQLKIVMLKDGVKVWESEYTPDLPTNRQSAWQRVNLGSVFLEEGVDEIRFVHWHDENAVSQSNSVFPAALCIRYSELPTINIPTLNCDPGMLEWTNNIDSDSWNNEGFIEIYDVRLGNVQGQTQFPIPSNLYPNVLGDGKDVTLRGIEVISFDVSINRTLEGDQPEEKFKIVFLKNNTTVWESEYTPDLATGEQFVMWHGNLNEDEFGDDGLDLENDVDTIKIVHWADGRMGVSDNSVYPAGVCIDMSGPTAVTLQNRSILKHNASILMWAIILLALLSCVTICNDKR